jgi:hypothetical protein
MKPKSPQRQRTLGEWSAHWTHAHATTALGTLPVRHGRAANRERSVGVGTEESGSTRQSLLPSDIFPSYVYCHTSPRWWSLITTWYCEEGEL